MTLNEAVIALEYGCIISNKDISNSFKGPITNKLLEELEMINENNEVDKNGWFLIPKNTKFNNDLS